jgi:hypothetical protein
LGDEDIALMAKRPHGGAIEGEGTRCRDLGRVDLAKTEEPAAHRGVGRAPIVQALLRPVGAGLEEAEGPLELGEGAMGRPAREVLVPILGQTADFLEESSLSVEEGGQRCHPNHPIP